jgi:hypothetical protein
LYGRTGRSEYQQRYGEVYSDLLFIFFKLKIDKIRHQK